MPTVVTFVDGTILTASDLNSNFSALNQAIGTGTAITTYTTGDMLYASAANTLSKRVAGTNGFVLQMVGGVPDWVRTGGAKFWLSPNSATFPTSNFPELKKISGTNWTDYVLAYDQTTSESAFWYVSLPLGLTVNAADLEVYSRQPAATSGTVGWTITTLTRADGEAFDTAGNADTVTADTVEGTAGQVHKQTVSLTITSWAADEVLQIKIARDIADTVAEDAYLIGACLRIR